MTTFLSFPQWWWWVAWGGCGHFFLFWERVKKSWNSQTNQSKKGFRGCQLEDQCPTGPFLSGKRIFDGESLASQSVCLFTKRGMKLFYIKRMFLHWGWGYSMKLSLFLKVRVHFYLCLYKRMDGYHSHTWFSCCVNFESSMHPTVPTYFYISAGRGDAEWIPGSPGYVDGTLHSQQMCIFSPRVNQCLHAQ